VPELATPPVAERVEPTPRVPAPRPGHCYTVEEYLGFERRADSKHEYYAGNIYAMVGASRRHVLIVTNIVRSLGNRLLDRPCELYSSDMRLKVVATGLYTYPDAAVVCGEPRFDDSQVDTLLNPQVVIEVLSGSTEEYDRGVKFDHYRGVESLTDYLLISQNVRRVEHRSRQSDGSWSLMIHEAPDAVIVLKSIEVELPTAEIYRRINLDA
jgi:Uma2 family endonuclease